MIRKICITNQSLVKGDFIAQMERVLSTDVYGVILREKEMYPSDYYSLAREMIQLCDEYDKPLILHHYIEVARKLKYPRIHLTAEDLPKLTDSDRDFFITIGASTHSVEDAINAEKLGCTYITASPIFETDCKRGLCGKGLDFLKRVCDSVSIPVFALGGISEDNMQSCVDAGAAGVCMMSEYMLLGGKKSIV